MMTNKRRVLFILMAFLFVLPCTATAEAYRLEQLMDGAALCSNSVGEHLTNLISLSSSEDAEDILSVGMVLPSGRLWNSQPTERLWAETLWRTVGHYFPSGDEMRADIELAAAELGIAVSVRFENAASVCGQHAQEEAGNHGLAGCNVHYVCDGKKHSLLNCRIHYTCGANAEAGSVPANATHTRTLNCGNHLDCMHAADYDCTQSTITTYGCQMGENTLVGGIATDDGRTSLLFGSFTDGTVDFTQFVMDGSDILFASDNPEALVLNPYGEAYLAGDGYAALIAYDVEGNFNGSWNVWVNQNQLYIDKTSWLRILLDGQEITTLTMYAGDTVQLETQVAMLPFRHSNGDSAVVEQFQLVDRTGLYDENRWYDMSSSSTLSEKVSNYFANYTNPEISPELQEK